VTKTNLFTQRKQEKFQTTVRCRYCH